LVAGDEGREGTGIALGFSLGDEAHYLGVNRKENKF
jgi:hypothetical protein